MTEPLTLIAGAIAVMLLILFLSRKRPHAAYIAKAILHDEEIEIYRHLVEALPNHLVFPQVAMAAILDVEADESETWRAMRNRIEKKYIDFVVAEADTLLVVGVVEYDGRLHDAEKDAERDARLNEAGYAVVRIPARPKPSFAQIARAVAVLEQVVPPLADTE